MRIDGTKSPEFVPCCGCKASKVMGISLDDATSHLWRKSKQNVS